MILWVLLGISVIVFFAVSLDSQDLAFGFMSGFAVGTLSLLFLITLSTIIVDTTQSESVRVHRMQNLQDNSGVEGRINGDLFVTTGYIGTYQFYGWYEEEPDGSFVSKQISTHDGPVKIWLRNTKEPRAIVHETCSQKSNPSWLIPFNFETARECTHLWDLYVPEGTIRHEFKLDSSG